MFDGLRNSAAGSNPGGFCYQCGGLALSGLANSSTA